MVSYVKAVRFLAAAGKKAIIEGQFQEQSVRPSGREPISFDIYFSRKKSSPVPIIFLHGMSPLGNRDPRQKKICFALAALGYTVYAPSIEGIKKLTLSANHIKEFIAFCRAIDSDTKFRVNEGYALFAPSFSGAICLQAAADPGLRDRIKSICLIGAFSDFATCNRYLFFDPEADQYARWLILANFLPELRIVAPKVIRAFKEEILAFWARSTGYPIEQSQVKLSPGEKKQLEAVMHDTNFMQKHYEKLVRVLQRIIAAYDIKTHVNEIKAHVLVLHGSNDNVIPASESANLYALLKKGGISCRLVISPFLNHANPELDFSLVKQMAELVGGLAYFFRHIR